MDMQGPHCGMGMHQAQPCHRSQTIRSDASSVRCIPMKALLLLTFENLVAPVRTWAISSRVGALWFSQTIALFRSLGSRQILSLPFAFFGYVRLLTHGVGSVCLVMILCWTISANSFSISSLYSMGTFHLLCWTGGTVGSVLMSYPACLLCSQSCWGTALGGSWYCQWSLILAPHRWG